jgi:hypothetical protein
MIDLEQELRVALHAYADTMPASYPPTSVASNQPMEAPPRDRRFLAAAAAVLIVCLGAGLLWFVRHPDGSAVTPSTPLVVGSWREPAAMPLSPRQFPSVLWTGSEFIVWGGQRLNSGLSDGAIYDPGSDRWRPMASNDRVRPGGLAVWADDSMVVLSGTGGEAYDPVSDRWSSMPTLDGVPASGGFTDAVWSGGTLLGIGVHTAVDSTQQSLSVWRLDKPGGRWIAAGTTTATGVGRPWRMVSTSEQFSVHDPITTDDGFVFWDGSRDGWRFSLGAGWERLPELAQYDVQVLIQNAEVVWSEGQLKAVALGQTATSSDTRVAGLAGGKWSAWVPVTSGAVMAARPVAAGRQIVVLGTVTPGLESLPLLIDPALATGSPMTGYVLQTVIDQGAGWSGTSLLICGGQTPDTGGEHTTGESGPISSQCALWTP